MSEKYIGNELHLFKDALNWKNYWSSKIKDEVIGDVLEVGAGIGVNTRLCLSEFKKIKTLHSIEPDSKLASEIIELNPTNSKLKVSNCYLKDLDNNFKYDVILYIDVIEHILEDSEEIKLAISFLKEGGKLIILVPAHNYLFSKFDKSIGHYRRYNKESLNNIIPNSLNKINLIYLDSFGILLSLSNKYLLKQNYPTKKQIVFWDKIFLPISIIFDKLFFNKLGKSLIGVWKKN